jgi:hypothetical protein
MGDGISPLDLFISIGFCSQSRIGNVEDPDLTKMDDGGVKDILLGIQGLSALFVNISFTSPSAIFAGAITLAPAPAPAPTIRRQQHHIDLRSLRYVALQRIKDSARSYLCLLSPSFNLFLFVDLPLGSNGLCGVLFLLH